MPDALLLLIFLSTLASGSVATTATAAGCCAVTKAAARLTGVKLPAINGDFDGSALVQFWLAFVIS